MRRLLILILVLSFVFAPTTIAAVKQGDKEFSLYGAYTSMKAAGGDKTDATIIATSLGYFFTDELELGLLGMGAWSSGTDLYSIGGNLKYHLLTESTIVPYLGGNILYANVNAGDFGSTDGFIYGPLVGMKIFVTESTSLFLEYDFQLYEGGIGDYAENSQMLMAGISFKF